MNENVADPLAMQIVLSKEREVESTHEHGTVRRLADNVRNRYAENRVKFDSTGGHSGFVCSFN